MYIWRKKKLHENNYPLAQLLLVFLCYLPIQAQLYPVSLQQRIQEAGKIILGTLESQHSFRSPADDQLYTLNQIKVQAYLKGVENDPAVGVITAGGEMEGAGRIVFPSVNLRRGELYLFFLEKEASSHLNLAFESVPQHRAYACVQGALPLQAGLFRDIFFESLSYREMLELVYAETQRSLQLLPGADLHHFLVENTTQASRMVMINSISSLNATGMAAGTIDSARIAVIQGSNFDPFNLGSFGNSIEFSNSADGGATFIGLDDKDTDIISWTDTEIRVKIPGGAGSGPVRLNIIVNGTATFPITIDWAVTPKYSHNQNWTDTMRQRLELVKEGNVSNNGYAFQFDSNFWTNTDAVNAFLQAVQTWRCNTFINLNFVAAANNAAFVSGNGSQVRFATSATLGAGVLAQANIRFRNTFSASLPSCVRENTLWYITDMDLLFLDNPTPNSWNFSSATTGATAYDFESMALKVIGLASGVGYTNQAGTAMYFDQALGQDIRNLTANEIVAGTHKVTHSVTSTPCKSSLASNGLMVAVAGSQGCVLSWQTEKESMELTVPTYPMISVGQNKEYIFLHIPASTAFPLALEVFDLHGKSIVTQGWDSQEDMPSFLKIDELSAGTYGYRFFNSQQSWSGKWIK